MFADCTIRPVGAASSSALLSDQGAATGTILGAAGHGSVTSALRAELAEAAAVVLTETGHESVTYDLAGETTWTFPDFAAAAADVTGRDVTYTNVTLEEYAAVLTQIGLPAEVVPAIAGIDAMHAAHIYKPEGTVLSDLLGQPTADLTASVRATLAN